MKFIINNFKALLLVIFVIVTEVISGNFCTVHSIIDGYSYTHGEMLYYFFNQFGYISFLPSIFIYLNEKNIDSKGIYLGLVIWNIIEVLQELNMLFELNITYLYKVCSPKSDYMQIIFITFTVILTYIAYRKRCCT